MPSKVELDVLVVDAPLTLDAVAGDPPIGDHLPNRPLADREVPRERPRREKRPHLLLDFASGEEAHTD
jgi:hypothetical protein